MCQHDVRHGAALEHGDAHEQDHRAWTRRGFLHSLAAAAVGSTFTWAGFPMRASAGVHDALSRHLLGSDRILILIELNGGNDGLNTVVPVDDDAYYNARPTLALPRTAVTPIADGLGLHRSMDLVLPMWNDGEMAIVQGVGYEAPNLSHFRSMDIWHAGSESSVVEDTGWLGRYLHAEHRTPAPDEPLAVGIGGALLPFRGPTEHMGMQIGDLNALDLVLRRGGLYDPDDVPRTLGGFELSFVRELFNATNTYAFAVQKAAERATNAVEYPSPPATLPAASTTRVADQLAVVARLIKGGLGARIYHVVHNGFDTHASQIDGHAALLQYLSETVKAFYADLASAGHAERTLTATFSEFGRRLNENGSRGTDHGAAAPLFLFGSGVAGGLYGQQSSLTDLDEAGNLKAAVDFRSVYRTLLQDWFGMPQEETDTLFSGDLPVLDFIRDPYRREDPIETSNRPDVPAQFAIESAAPNPFQVRTTLHVRLGVPQRLHLTVYDTQGRLVADVLNAPRPSGRHQIEVDGSRWPAGVYFARLSTEAGEQTFKLVKV